MKAQPWMVFGTCPNCGAGGAINLRKLHYIVAGAWCQACKQINDLKDWNVKLPDRSEEIELEDQALEYDRRFAAGAKFALEALRGPHPGVEAVERYLDMQAAIVWTARREGDDIFVSGDRGVPSSAIEAIG